MNPPDPARGFSTPTVTARGEAVLRVEPDEAVLWITLSSLEDAPGAALSAVAARSRALFELLDELAVAKPDRSRTGVTVHEEFDHTETGRRSLGHRALATAVAPAEQLPVEPGEHAVAASVEATFTLELL